MNRLGSPVIQSDINQANMVELINWFSCSLPQISFGKVQKPVSAPSSPPSSRASTPLPSDGDDNEDEDEDEVDSEEEREELGKRVQHNGHTSPSDADLGVA